ncbi:hypothetical protein PAL_GLEAN10006353 [Pteropus alecto]|uniref:Uncharacterized protein n=1 Tax=Pteropus alecto TaxID=9402 RepID=L5KCF1_PTEAL|nr:hypothetical protein PAL_GLEAN10006353 [Pteropus alecto]
MQWPVDGDRVKDEGSAFGAEEAEWLEQAPQPAMHCPGLSPMRGRIRPPTPAPGPWRVHLNSREAQRLATTTVFLEEMEDMQEAGEPQPALPPKEVFVCWGEPSGLVGLPVAQGRPRANLCTARSVQFSCSSMDSVEPADGSPLASPECPKADQSDLWEEPDL